MMIAVTENDEVNLVACQVAYTLFGVPRKIARVDSQYFLNPLWNKLYNEKVCRLIWLLRRILK